MFVMTVATFWTISSGDLVDVYGLMRLGGTLSLSVARHIVLLVEGQILAGIEYNVKR
jgi:hypothetical protein